MIYDNCSLSSVVLCNLLMASLVLSDIFLLDMMFLVGLIWDGNLIGGGSGPLTAQYLFVFLFQLR